MTFDKLKQTLSINCAKCSKNAFKTIIKHFALFAVTVDCAE